MGSYPPTQHIAQLPNDKLRTIAMDVVNLRLKPLGLSATEIDSSALQASNVWIFSKNRRNFLDWDYFYTVHTSRYSRYFALALRHQGHLVSLAVGGPTADKSGMRLDLVEASPRDLYERPKVLGSVLLAFEVYANIVGANHIRIINPVSETLKTYYQGYGYQGYFFDGLEKYLRKDIKNN